IIGSHFTSDSAPSISGAGITVSSVAFTPGVGAPDQLVVTYSIAPSAPIGTRNVTVTNPDGGTATCAACFEVMGVQGRDFNADGKPDILWHNTQTGDVAVWLLNGTQFVSGGPLGGERKTAR